MVVGFTTTCATSAYHHKICEFESINIDIYLGLMPINMNVEAVYVVN
jgi:hypothetical protein